MKALLSTLLLLLTTGCLERLILDGTIAGTRKASPSFDTLSDLKVAETGAGATLTTLEGYYFLAPDNEDNLFLLMQSWAGYAGAFIEDGWERAQDSGDEAVEEAESLRARQAYDRSIRYGTELLERRKPGFKEAQRNSATIAEYLSTYEASDADALLWLGVAWLSRGGVASTDSEVVSELFVGVALLERSVALDATRAYGLGQAVLGAYHARSPDAELKQAQELFEKAMLVSGRKALTVQVLYANTWACITGNQPQHKALLEEVLAAGDVLPQQRLENTLAVRKAHRYLGKPRLARCGFKGE